LERKDELPNGYGEEQNDTPSQALHHAVPFNGSARRKTQ
jgi:hypothetical protein